MSPSPTLDQPVTTGCTGVAEEGNARTPPRSARPSLGLPAHETRATGRRRRKAPTRWMLGVLSKSPSLHGGKRFRGCFSRFRGSRHVGLVLAKGKSPRRTELEGGCGRRRDARVEARECARTSFLKNRLQKSIGDHCWLHRSSFTGRKAGSIARSAGSEREPSPTR
jgi:hypothetical protein